ncbi:MCM DNA helicase complex subunit, partial [Podila horticola]
MATTAPAASSITSMTAPSTSTDKSMPQEQQFQPSDFSFLTQLLNILNKTEAGGVDNQELASMAGNLKNSFKKCQMILDHLPGADLSPDEQERVLAEELQILERKKAQLAEYLSWQVFDHKVDAAITEPSELTTGVIGAREDTAGTPLDAPSNTVDTPSEIQVKLEDTDIASQSPTAAPSVDMQSPPSQGVPLPSQLRSEISSDLADADRKRQRDDGPPSTPAAWIPPSSPVMGSSPPMPLSDPDEEGLIGDEMISDLENEEGEGEDLYGSDMEKDYAENSERDQYDPEYIDDEDFERMDPAQRAQVEAVLARRDAEKERAAGRIPEAFMDDDGEGLNVSNVILGPEQLGDHKGLSISEWVTKELTRRTIMAEFRRFLLEYLDNNGESVYGPLIRTLGEANRESLEVCYRHLSEAKPTLAYFVVNAPQEVLKMFDAVAFEVVQMEYPDYGRIHSEIHVRITDLPIVSTLRDLRQINLNCLVQVTGVVTRRTGVFPQLKYVNAKPGEEVEITGVYRNNFDVTLNSANGFPVFATILEANYVNKKQDVFASFKLTEEDRKEILRLGKDENIGKR